LATAQKERWTKAQNSDVLCVTQDEAIKWEKNKSKRNKSLKLKMYVIYIF
jgi:hypothetical protein